MVVGEMPEGIDLLVVGGGPGGYTAALDAAALGRSVTLVDAAGTDGLGGTCLLRGCIPSKGLIELADTLDRARHLGGGALAGMLAAGTEASAGVDLAAFQTWKSSMVTGLSRGVGSRLDAAGVDVVAGRFTFTGPGRGVVELGEDHPPKHYEFADVIIATGSTPVEIPPLPFSDPRIHDAAGILDLAEVPDRLVVVGGGYIGMELGTALAKLGSRVTVVETLDSILTGAADRAARLVARRARELGIEILTGHRALGLSDEGLMIESASEPGGRRRVIPADAVLVAVGRRPNTGDLGLAEAGVAVTDSGHIEVDSGYLAKRHIAAIGDVVAGPALAHKATAEAKVAAASVSGRTAALIPTVIPQVMFTDPEIAIARLEADAASAGQTRTARLPLGFSGRAATMGQNRGYAEIEVEEDTGAIVAGTVVGPHASELIGEIALAIEMGASPEDLALTIHPHPTLSEMWPDTAALHPHP